MCAGMGQRSGYSFGCVSSVVVQRTSLATGGCSGIHKYIVAAKTKSFIIDFSQIKKKIKIFTLKFIEHIILWI